MSYTAWKILKQTLLFLKNQQNLRTFLILKIPRPETSIENFSNSQKVLQQKFTGFFFS